MSTNNVDILFQDSLKSKVINNVKQVHVHVTPNNPHLLDIALS